MTATPIDRRKVLGVVAAVPATMLASAPAFASGEPGQLAVLVRRYFAEIDAFNAFALADERTDEQVDACAAPTYEKTMLEMIGVPAITREDALAALDWLIKDGADLSCLDLCNVAGSLVDAIRGISKGGWHDARIRRNG